MIHLRPAIDTSDLQAVRDLLYEYFELRIFDAALGDYKGELAGLPGAYAAPEGSLLLATWQEKPAGCVAFRRLDTSYCEMKRMFVRPILRGKGIGKALFKGILQAAQEADYTYMRLDTHPSMKAAQALYQSYGFVEIDRYNDNPIPGIRFFELKLRG